MRGCNLYSHTSNIEAIRRLVGDFKRVHENIGNLEPQPGIFPDYSAPIVRNPPEGSGQGALGPTLQSEGLYDAAARRADKLRAKTKDFDELLKLEPDSGTTNVRNIFNGTRWNGHWNRWMGVENRCVVPFTSFSEFDNTFENGKKNGDTWFAFDESRPLAFFAGIWVKDWTSMCKVRTGVETTNLFGFLTCEPNDVVGSIHMKAMPVILTEPDEMELWLTAPKEEAIKLRRPLPNGGLQFVALGESRTKRLRHLQCS